MNCRHAQKLLPDYAANFLEGEARQRLQQHFDTCDTCREKLGQLVSLDRLLTADQVQAGEGLVVQVMDRVCEVDFLRRRWRRDLWDGVGFTLTAATATAFVVVLAGSAAQSLATVEWWESTRQLFLRPEAASARAIAATAAGAALVWMADRVVGQFA